MSFAFSDLDPQLRDEDGGFASRPLGAVEGRPLFARLLDAMVDAGLPGDRSRSGEGDPS